MAFKTFIKTSPSMKSAGVGFLPIVSGGRILKNFGDLVNPAIIEFRGQVFHQGTFIDMHVQLDSGTNTQTPYTVPSEMTKEQVAIGYASFISGITNLTALAVGATIELTPELLATTVDIRDLIVQP